VTKEEAVRHEGGRYEVQTLKAYLIDPEVHESAQPVHTVTVRGATVQEVGPAMVALSKKGFWVSWYSLAYNGAEDTSFFPPVVR